MTIEIDNSAEEVALSTIAMGAGCIRDNGELMIRFNQSQDFVALGKTDNTDPQFYPKVYSGLDLAEKVQPTDDIIHKAVTS